MGVEATLVRSVVVDAVREVAGSEAPLDDDATLEALDVDSLGLIEVGMMVEERFDIVVDAERFEGVSTLNGAVDVFVRLIDEQRDHGG